MSKNVNVNDIIVFNPKQFEVSRTTEQSPWIRCDGLKYWRGNQVPFVAIACFIQPPNGMNEDVLKYSHIKWNMTNLEWAYIPCDSASCMLVIENQGVYFKLMPLSEDFQPAVDVKNYWVSTSTLEHGINVGIIQVLP